MTDFTLNYAHSTGGQGGLTVKTGGLLFVLGPNGSGKSTMMQAFSMQHRGHVRRLAAHRQVWFQSDAVNLTPQSRQSTETQIENSDTQAQSRWRDDHANQRSQAIIFDLIDSENVEARNIAEAARSGDLVRVQELAAASAPVAQINEMLRIANLHFQVSVSEGSRLVALRAGHPEYSIAELSDGERNALITAANVLTAKPGTLFLIDEPERHLHRSVVSPLISTLLSHRPDCAFVVSTHDISLPLDQPECSALLIRNYNHSPQRWECDFIEKVEELDESTSEAILGSRRQVLFVEGEQTSLDLQLYQILFPKISIKSLTSCVEVERAVKGLKAADGNHWIDAFGLIDRDNRDSEECARLLESGIVALEHYSVESLYYHPSTFANLAKKVCEAPEASINLAEQNFLATVEPHKRRLAARMVERNIRNKVLSLCPTWREIEQGYSSFDFDGCDDLLSQELARFNDLAASRSVGQITSRYPIRETPGANAIAQALGFSSRQAYEGAVRKMLIDSSDSKVQMLSLVSSLEAALNQNDGQT